MKEYSFFFCLIRHMHEGVFFFLLPDQAHARRSILFSFARSGTCMKEYSFFFCLIRHMHEGVGFFLCLISHMNEGVFFFPLPDQAHA